MGSHRQKRAINKLADEIIEDVSRVENIGSRYFVGIAGGPGSGKSTMAKLLCRQLNRQLSTNTATSCCWPRDEPAIVIPMDGFHYTRAHLDVMYNPKEAHRRRGAHWTIDSESFIAQLGTVKAFGSQGKFPSFNHAVGDPCPDDIHVTPRHRIVIVEGLYLFLDVPPWNALFPLLDKTCFIKCSVGLTLARITNRKVHVLGMDENEAKESTAYNDKKNAITVWKTRHKADVFLPSG